MFRRCECLSVEHMAATMCPSLTYPGILSWHLGASHHSMAVGYHDVWGTKIGGIPWTVQLKAGCGANVALIRCLEGPCAGGSKDAAALQALPEEGAMRPLAEHLLTIADQAGCILALHAFISLSLTSSLRNFCSLHVQQGLSCLGDCLRT